jgi:hypothetical protein
LRKKRGAKCRNGRECFTGLWTLGFQSSLDQSLVRPRMHERTVTCPVYPCVVVSVCESASLFPNSDVPYLLNHGPRSCGEKRIFRWLVIRPTDKVGVLLLTELYASRCCIVNYFMLDRRNNCLPWASLLISEQFLDLYKQKSCEALIWG